MLSSKHLGGITDNEQTYKATYFVALSAKVKKKFKNFIKIYKYKRSEAYSAINNPYSITQLISCPSCYNKKIGFIRRYDRER